MSVRCYLIGKYTSESIKGIIGGSDRMNAVQTLVEAAGGKVNHSSFVRGPMDVIVDCEVPDHETMMGLVTTVLASGSMEDAMYLECVDADPIWVSARKMASSYTAANA